MASDDGGGGRTACHQFIWTAAWIPNDAPVKISKTLQQIEHRACEKKSQQRGFNWERGHANPPRHQRRLQVLQTRLFESLWSLWEKFYVITVNVITATTCTNKSKLTRSLHISPDSSLCRLDVNVSVFSVLVFETESIDAPPAEADRTWGRGFVEREEIGHRGKRRKVKTGVTDTVQNILICPE